MTDTLLVKIAALLRKAESTTPEEAESLITKAQSLASAHAIDLAIARSYVPAHERVEQPEMRDIRIGYKGTKGLSTFVELFTEIAHANDIKCDIASNSTFVYAYGMPSDIDTTEALYSSLVVQCAQFAKDFIARGEWKSETVWRDGHWNSYEWVSGGYRPVSALTARINFQQGFAIRIGQRLRKARAEAIEARKAAERNIFAQALPEAQVEQAEQSHSTDLVLRAKTQEVANFHKSRSTARGSYKGGKYSSSYGSQRAGASAANQARLSAPGSLGGSRKAIA